MRGVSVFSTCQLSFKQINRFVTGQYLSHAGIRLAPLADRGEELAVLKLDTVHRDIHLRHIDLLFLAVDQIIVAGDVGAAVADIAEERSKRSVVIEREAQSTDSPGTRLQL